MKIQTQKQSFDAYLDPAEIEKRFGSRMDLETVATIYLEEMPGVQQQLKALLSSEIDFEQSRVTAHSLKGSFAMLSAEPIVKAAKDLERAASTQQASQSRNLCRKLLDQLDGLTSALKDFLQNGRGEK